MTIKTGTKIVMVVVVVAVAIGFVIAGYHWLAGLVGLFGGLTVAQVKAINTKAEKAGQDAKQEVLDTDPHTVVDGLSDDAKGRIDAAKSAGVDAGVATGLDALHRGRGGSGTQGGDQGGA